MRVLPFTNVYTVYIRKHKYSMYFDKKMGIYLLCKWKILICHFFYFQWNSHSSNLSPNVHITFKIGQSLSKLIICTILNFARCTTADSTPSWPWLPRAGKALRLREPESVRKVALADWTEQKSDADYYQTKFSCSNWVKYQKFTPKKWSRKAP